jgi:hypothetical protein
MSTIGGHLGYKVFDSTLGNSTTAGGGTITGAATYYSKPTNIRHARFLSYLIDTVGAAIAGTLTVEVSNASDEDVNNSLDTWTTYTPVGSVTVTGSTTFGIEIPDVTFGRARLKLVVSAGTGIITARIAEKG